MNEIEEFETTELEYVEQLLEDLGLQPNQTIAELIEALEEDAEEEDDDEE